MTTPSTNPPPAAHAGEPGWKQALDAVLQKALVLLATAALAFVATLLHDLQNRVSHVQDQVTQLPPDLGQAVNQLGTALGNQVDTLAQRPAQTAPVVNVTAPRAPAAAPTTVTVTNPAPAAAPASKPSAPIKPAVPRATPSPTPSKPACLVPGLLCR